MNKMKEKKPKKCCFNCGCAMKASERNNERAVEFNKTRRFCGETMRNHSYNVFELRHCKYFSLDDRKFREEFYFDE